MRCTFREWVDPRTGEGAFSTRYQALDDKGQAKCDARMLYLRDAPPRLWVDPSARKLDWSKDENCKDVYEIKFSANRIEQRPMGYFGRSASEFTIVVWVTHKGKQYRPRDFCRIACERRDAIGTSREHFSREVEMD